MSKHLFPLTLLGFLTPFLIGCQQQPTTTSHEFTRISEIENVDEKIFSISGLRHYALRDTALSLGARGGLAWRASQIRGEVYRHERKLDLIFNFYGLILDDNVLPPVLIEGRQTLDQPQDDTLRIADRAYVIIQQARFVTAPPNWRDYLKMDYAPPDLPDRSLLPRNAAEKSVWERYIREGWQAGIVQANTIFLENLGRLKRDYEGMIRYHTLLAQGMVTKPFVARMELGITGDEDEMAVNDRILRITVKPSFALNGKWKPEIVQNKSLQLVQSTLVEICPPEQ
ncbi:MAG TPA: type IV secretory system conjugative DNA transfer family protein [Gammaproteobacteria bacterium]|nr:type IV secretory system conjugative DNA transfer family protein [Gammaproteobacteria bacterium]